MRSDEQYADTEGQSPRPHRFELFFFEAVGNRSYLRFTRLAVILILCLTVIPLIALFTFVLFRSDTRSLEQINANVPLTVRPESTPIKNVIIQAPPPKPPSKARHQPLPPARVELVNALESSAVKATPVPVR